MIILSVVILIVFRVFYIIIRDYKKNKNFCSTDCGS
ncbi:MAG: FeoB-associated Cys-rich membrane protein, partial [Leptotrichiaceae bacterium]